MDFAHIAFVEIEATCGQRKIQDPFSLDLKFILNNSAKAKFLYDPRDLQWSRVKPVYGQIFLRS